MIQLVSAGETLGLTPQPRIQTSPKPKSVAGLTWSQTQTHNVGRCCQGREGMGEELLKSPWTVFTDPIPVQCPRKNFVFYWNLGKQAFLSHSAILGEKPSGKEASLA